MTTTWNNCTCDIYYRDERPVLNDPGYAIRIEGDELTICYKGSQGQITYKGKPWISEDKARHRHNPA